MQCSKLSISSWQIAITYIGTVVGAGFASGQETLQFFAAYGSPGLLGILITTLGFGFFGAYILAVGHHLQADSYQPLFTHICGRFIGRIIDFGVTIFLFGASVVMLAGVGAIFTEYFGLPRLWGVLGTVVLTWLTLYRGLSGLITANTVLIPLMALLTLAISLLSLNHHGITVSDLTVIPKGIAVAPHWLIATVLYLSYNLILAVPVLGPLGCAAREKQMLLPGALLGGFGLGLLSMLLALVLMAHFPHISLYQIPMLYIVQPYAVLFRTIFAVILWGEIFTTLIANLYGFANRVAQQTGWTYLSIVTLSLLSAAALSGVGFSTLVGTVYPFLGYCGLVFLVAIMARVLTLILPKYSQKKQ